jgi:hypothetical protein
MAFSVDLFVDFFLRGLFLLKLSAILIHSLWKNVSRVHSCVEIKAVSGWGLVLG